MCPSLGAFQSEPRKDYTTVSIHYSNACQGLLGVGGLGKVAKLIAKMVVFNGTGIALLCATKVIAICS